MSRLNIIPNYPELHSNTSLLTISLSPISALWVFIMFLMEKLERTLKIINLAVGNIVFGFLIWLMLVSQNFTDRTSFIISGFMMVGI